MDHITLILVCWAVCTGLFVALMIYRGQLTRHEVDVVHLSETDGHDDTEHDHIVHRVEALGLPLRLAGAAAALCTVWLAVAYVRDLMAHSHF